MLDVLAELIIDLIQGKDQKKKQKKAQPKQPAPPQRQGGHWPEPSAKDPYVQKHPSDQPENTAARGNPGKEGMTIEEVMRSMYEKVVHGGSDAPVLDQEFHPRAPQRKAAVQRPQQPSQSSRRAAQAAARRPQSQAQPKPAQPPPQPAHQAQPPRTYSPPPGHMPAELTLAKTDGSTPAAELAAKLRGNPNAARDAFIFSEVFGRPLGERT